MTARTNIALGALLAGGIFLALLLGSVALAPGAVKVHAAQTAESVQMVDQRQLA